MGMRRDINLAKAAAYAIAINGTQIVLVAAIVGYALLGWGSQRVAPVHALILGTMGLITCWGAAVDIREALDARRVGREADTLEQVNGHMNELNLTLRAQRHDFMNHVQVVYSLLEMDERQAAISYLETVYRDLQRVGKSLKTRVPAVNALLAAKLSDCEDRGVAAELTVDSPWDRLPMEGWEICRVLGNLIDNALDALEGRENPRLRICLGETLREYTFLVANNGPQIPPELSERAFQAGYSTKSSGRGMGLSIVRELMHARGGEIRLESEPGETRFFGILPRTSEDSIQAAEEVR